MHEVYRDMYEALGVTDVERIMQELPDSEPRPTDPAQENINSMDMMQLHAFTGQDHQSHITAHLVFGSSPMVAQMAPVAVSLQKHILEHVKIQSEEQAMQQMPQSQGGDESQMEMQYQALVAQLVAQGMQQVKEMSGQMTGQGPDPLIQLKEKELEIKAQSEQSDAQVDQAKLQLDAQNQQMRGEQFQQRLASQEAQTTARIDSAMQREVLKQRGQNNG
tara:strand:- start:1389 stop:2045 length:657 start_codon:yes stop_codon:yes gene_type:complete